MVKSKITDIKKAYEFKPGCIYIIEYDEHYISHNQAKAIVNAFNEVDIIIYMVGSRSGNALRPLEATEVSFSTKPTGEHKTSKRASPGPSNKK